MELSFPIFQRELEHGLDYSHDPNKVGYSKEKKKKDSKKPFLMLKLNYSFSIKTKSKKQEYPDRNQETKYPTS